MKIFFLMLLSLWSFISYSQSENGPSTDTYKNQIDQLDLSKVDPIVGIYNVQVVTNFSMRGGESGIVNFVILPTSDINIFWCNWGQVGNITKIGNMNIYNLETRSSQYSKYDKYYPIVRITLENYDQIFSYNYYVPKEELIGLGFFKYYSSPWIEYNVSAIKTYPTQTMYKEAKTKTN